MSDNDGSENMAALTSEKPVKPLIKAFAASLLRPPVFASFIGLAVGLIEPLSFSLFPPPTDTDMGFGVGLLAGFGRAIFLVGNMGIALGAMLMSASLTYKPKNEITETEQRIGAVAPCSIALPEGAGVDISGCPIPGASDAVAIATLCCIRLVLVPAVGFALMWAIMAGETSPFQGARGGLRALIVLVSFSVPSGQTAISVMATMQFHLLGKRLAEAYVVMYLACALTMSLWTALALSIVESYVWSALDE
jgi:hypothetical protein